MSTDYQSTDSFHYFSTIFCADLSINDRLELFLDGLFHRLCLRFRQRDLPNLLTLMFEVCADVVILGGFEIGMPELIPYRHWIGPLDVHDGTGRVPQLFKRELFDRESQLGQQSLERLVNIPMVIRETIRLCKDPIRELRTLAILNST